MMDDDAGGATVGHHEKRRVKVLKRYPRKMFFEKALADWRESVDVTHFRSTLWRALSSVRAFPLELATISDLKILKGVGDHIAQKLEGAWQVYCSQNLAAPSVEQVDRLKKGDCLQFINSATYLQKRGEIVPTRPLAEEIEKQKKQKSVRKRGINLGGIANVPCNRPVANGEAEGMSTSVASTSEMKSHPNVPIRRRPAKRILAKEVVTKEVANVDHDVRQHQSVSVTLDVNEENEGHSDIDSFYTYHPSQFSSSKVVLIIDNREASSTAKYKRMCSVLNKKGITYEMRSLSVGDYLWILRFNDGQELVLDYIVERKTAYDLWKSIREKRYDEQKRRLMAIGIPNVVYLLEGSALNETALEQALINTNVENRFLIHRTNTADDTAIFIARIANRFIGRARREEMRGMSFDFFQKASKKTQRLSVSDLFIRQLTVCPQMSSQKASLIVDRYPTFATLANLYSAAPADERPMLLHNNVPGISKALSALFSKFFSKIDLC